ncbi:MAG TPA: hypothetical protein VLL97_08240 [Acidobacteriota bacterium]|nr:hypothetical protein [Acidobacteriota bacterium]
MKDNLLPSNEAKLRIKEPVGWFVVGEGFRCALGLLSDGAFKLFAYLSLQADRRTGRMTATHKELAAAVGKSKRVVGTYVAELEAKRVCNVLSGKNQFMATVYEISDRYWPYHREPSFQELPEIQAYVESVRERYEKLGCTTGKLNAAGSETARQFHGRSIPFNVVDGAMLLGACRKYESWLNGGLQEPIRSMAYFEPLVAEVQANPLPDGYSRYLRGKLRRLAESWEKATSEEKKPS